MATAKIKTKKLTHLQQAALDALLVKDLGFSEMVAIGAFGPTIAWLAKAGLTSEVAVPVEGRSALRAWTITDAGRAAQQSGRVVVAPKTPEPEVETDAQANPEPRAGAAPSM